MLSFSMLAVSFLCSKSPSSPHHSPKVKTKKSFKQWPKAKQQMKNWKNRCLHCGFYVLAAGVKTALDGDAFYTFILVLYIYLVYMCIYARIFIKPQLNLVPNLNPFLCIGSKSYRTRTFAFVFVYIQIN